MADTIQTLNSLKSQHRDLERQKIEAETSQRSLEAELSSLQAEMKEQFGVNSIDELRAMFEALGQENQEMVAKFSAELASIQGKLNALKAEA